MSEDTMTTEQDHDPTHASVSFDVSVTNRFEEVASDEKTVQIVEDGSEFSVRREFSGAEAIDFAIEVLMHEGVNLTQYIPEDRQVTDRGATVRPKNVSVRLGQDTLYAAAHVVDTRKETVPRLLLEWARLIDKGSFEFDIEARGLYSLTDSFLDPDEEAFPYDERGVAETVEEATALLDRTGGELVTPAADVFDDASA